MRVGWYNAENGEITVTIQASSGAASGIKYWQDTEITTKPEDNGTPGGRMIQLEISTDGKTTIIAVEVDEDGNESEEYATETIKIDKTKPDITVKQKAVNSETIDEVTSDPTGWYNEDVEITVEVEDSGSGANGYKYQVKEGNAVTKSIALDTWISAKEEDKIEFNTDGIHAVAIKGLDVAENESDITTVGVRIDTTPPTFSPESLTVTSISTTGFKVSGTATDNLSGNTTNGKITYTCKVKDKSSSSTETVGSVAPSTSENGEFTVSGLTPNGQYEVTMTATDPAGNSKDISTTVNVNGELSEPDIKLDAIDNKKNGDWYTGNIKITIKDTTNATISGATGIDYTIYNGTTQLYHTSVNTIDTEYIYNQVDGKDLSVTAYLTGNEKNGTQSGTPKTVKFKKDTVAPTVTLGEVPQYDTSITVTANAKDVTSGIKSYEFQYKETTASEWASAGEEPDANVTRQHTYNLQEKHTYHLRVKVTDNAGHVGYSDGSDANGEHGNTELPSVQTTCEHNWTTTSETPGIDCEHEGETLQTCSICKRTQTIPGPKGEHQWYEDKQDATCTDAGYSKEICIVCNASQNETSIPSLGHSWAYATSECRGSFERSGWGDVYGQGPFVQSNEYCGCCGLGLGNILYYFLSSTQYKCPRCNVYVSRWPH